MISVSSPQAQSALPLRVHNTISQMFNTGMYLSLFLWLKGYLYNLYVAFLSLKQCNLQPAFNKRFYTLREHNIFFIICIAEYRQTPPRY